MHFFTSILLASLLLTGLATLPTHSDYASTQNLHTEQSYLVQKTRQPKHRGSGRREIVGLMDVHIG